MDLITKYFPDLSPSVAEKFEKLEPIYREWNSRINVISRKDMDFFYLHHVLHSLALTRFITIPSGSTILDIGTGGGFPGIPLAILLPKCKFTLIDSIAKKTRVASAVAEELALSNVKVITGRAESVTTRFDFVIARAVAPFDTLMNWSSGKIVRNGKGGFIFLKGGELTEELGTYHNKVVIHDIKSLFTEDYFEGKKIVYLSS